MKSYSEQVGDGRVEQLLIDFKAKKTTIVLGRWTDADVAEKIVIEFTGVELQNFKEFNTFNLFHSIDEASDSAEFWQWNEEWLRLNRNYTAVGVLEAIEADHLLRYFAIEAGCGFDGFVICKDFVIVSRD